MKDNRRKYSTPSVKIFKMDVSINGNLATPGGGGGGGIVRPPKNNSAGGSSSHDELHYNPFLENRFKENPFQ